MPRTFTLAELIAQVRASGEFLDPYHPDDEVTTRINEGIAELRDLVIRDNPDYYVTQATVDLVANQEAYALPSDFFRLRLVEGKGTDGRYRELAEFSFGDRGAYSLAGSSQDASALVYRVVGSYLRVLPVPTVAVSAGLQLWYTPTATKLVNLSDTCDGVDGWQEYVVSYAAAQCARKEEQDSGPYEAGKAAVAGRIKALVQRRQVAQPARVRDVVYGAGGLQYRRRLPPP